MFFEGVALLVGHFAQEVAFHRQRLDGMLMSHRAHPILDLFITLCSEP